MPIILANGLANLWISIDNDAVIEQDFLLWEEPDGYFVTDATGIDRILLH
jgi:hypothetical protein